MLNSCQWTLQGWIGCSSPRWLSSSIKLFEVLYQDGRTDLCEGHAETIRSRWIRSTWLVQIASWQPRRVSKHPQLGRGYGLRSSYSLRLRLHGCGCRIFWHWWHEVDHSFGSEAPATSSWTHHPFQRFRIRSGKPSRTCWNWVWSCQPWTTQRQ